MKRTIKLSIAVIIMASILTLSSCNSEQKKAERFVRDYVKERLNDPSSYESVSFSEIKKVKRTFEQSASYKIYGEAFLEAKKDFDFAKMFDNLDDMRLHLDRMNAFDSILKVGKADWCPETEYQITHTYRAKNQLGGIITSETTYYIDTAFQVVTYTE